ncbi:MAG: hypothetical protein PHV33_13130 [Elusimicrobiales bacterium]|nr:hypothetical protein [Elusimicrobiales bacterium]
MKKEKFGTLQLRINLTKTGPGTVKFSGPVSAHDQKEPGAVHNVPLTKSGMGHYIRGRESDVLVQIKNAIARAGYKVKQA